MAPTRKHSVLPSHSVGAGSISKPTRHESPSKSTSIFPLSGPKPTASHPRSRKHEKKPHVPTRLNKTRASTTGVSKPGRKLRRRRTGKTSVQGDVRSEKLLSTLSTLAEALPDPSNDGAGHSSDGREDEDRKKGTLHGVKTREVDGVKVLISRPNGSLKSRPGAMKKRAKVERAERERFGMNMAVLAGLNGGVGGLKMDGVEKTADDARHARDGEGVETGNSAGRWEALRNYIKLTI